MPDYKVYVLTRSGHIYGRADMAAADDEEIVRLAIERLGRSDPLEIWRDKKMVAQVDALPQR